MATTRVALALVLGCSLGAALAGCGADGAGTDDNDRWAAAAEAFSFVALGDTQFYLSKCQESFTGFASAAPGLPNAVEDLAPSLVLITGDLMANGADEGAYAGFKYCHQQLLSRFPVFPVAGNHDLLGQGRGGDNFREYLHEQLLATNPRVAQQHGLGTFAVNLPGPAELPGISADPKNPSDLIDPPSGFSNKTYYSFRHRNAFFIAMEVGQHSWLSTPLAWLEGELQRARGEAGHEADHLFVFLHNPLYATTMGDWGDPEGYVTGPVRAAYEALFRQYQVTMVFSGHAHLYDRFYVPSDPAACLSRLHDEASCARAGCAWSATARACSDRTRQALTKSSRYPLTRNAIHYLVTGGGGGGNLNKCEAPRNNLSARYAQGRRCARHFVHVAVQGQRLALRVIELWGYSADPYSSAVIEEITIEPGSL